MDAITRRTALGRIGCASALTLGARRAFPASIYRDRKSGVFVLAGDRYHNIDYIRTALGKTIGRDLGLSLDFNDELTLLTAKHLKGFKLIVMIRDGMLWPTRYAAGAPRVR